jgi:choline dehydrogenase-like flavoprotein
VSNGTSGGSRRFDYLVIGAGSAGCALAARLSEDGRHTVALLEAGGSARHPYIRTPAAVAAAIGHPPFNWGLTTAPQPGLDGRRIPIPRGHVLGGSGSLNGMVYHRGHPLDYEDWARAGAAGWGYARVLPYFTRSENNEDYPTSAYHGHDGPINVRFPTRPNRMSTAFIDSVVGLGFPRCEDFVGPRPEGVGLRQATIRQGQRESTATAFLAPASARRNLSVVTGARVLRVLFEGRRAVAVDVLQESQKVKYEALGEIILCAGAIHSPQLLLCSGIGDRDPLASLDIPMVHHLPAVGRDLQDHLASPVRMSTRDTAPYGVSLRTVPRSLWNVLEYVVARRGPLSSNVFESAAFLRTDPGLDRPDFQFVFQPAKFPRPGIPIPLGHGFGVSPVLLYPQSRGRITLSSPSMLDPPLIDPALLAHPEDLARMVRAVKLCRRILSAAPFSRYQASEDLPGTRATSEADIERFIRATAATVHHPVGTCRMGSDPDSVVDVELKVRGVDGLRVADASIFPRIIGGNTNAPTVMVAEKAADLVLGRDAPAPAMLDSNDVTRQPF